MDFLADTWVFWLILTVIAMLGMGMYRATRRSITTTFTSAEDFSVRTLFLNFNKGEGDLFIGFLIAMISFSLFVAGLLRWVPSMIG